MSGLLDPIKMDIPLEGEVSENAADLDAKIAQELGIPVAPAEEEPKAPEVPAEEPAPVVEEEITPPVEPETPVEEPKEEPKPVEKAPEVTPPASPANTDLFIEVEDAEGNKHQITKIEDLPEDFEPKNNRQGLEILHQLSKLEVQIADKAKADEAIAQEQERKDADAARYKSWDNEVSELIKQGRLEKVAVPVTDPKYQDDPSVKRMDQVFAHMNKINSERQQAGNPNMLTSFEDALDKLEAAEAKAAAEDAKKRETQAAKAKSSLIGGSSSAGGSDFVYVSGAYKNIDDIPLT
jgi:hypothetical protein